MTAMTTTDVQQAATELAKMRSSLAAWLKYRSLNDQVLAGSARVRKPLSYAQRVVASRRDIAVEQDLANKLSALLERLLPGQDLPDADLSANPMGAVQLANIALTGASVSSTPTATGNFLTASSGSHPWLWPVLIVGGLLLITTTAIKTAADVAKDQEEKACIEAGACTDYGFWLKAGGVLALAWFAWEKMGVREMISKKARS
jgi:hypothetical protein